MTSSHRKSLGYSAASVIQLDTHLRNHEEGVGEGSSELACYAEAAAKQITVGNIGDGEDYWLYFLL